MHQLFSLLLIRPRKSPPTSAPLLCSQYVASRAAGTAVDLDATTYSKTKQVANPWWGARFIAATDSPVVVTAGAAFFAQLSLALPPP